MSSWEWEFQVVTQTGNYQTVRVPGSYNQVDAQDAALSMTGAKRVATWNQVALESFDSPYEVDNDEEPEVSSDYFYEKLDEMEIEMYDLMCKIAMREGNELPTISEFYEWLESN